MRILGVDLGQSKSAWELLDTQTGSVVNGWVAMETAKLLKLLERQRPELVVFESGPLAARVHDLVVGAGVAVQVADTTQDAWQWRNVKRKTDADDAHKLVRLAALGQINPGAPGSTFQRRRSASGGICWSTARRWWPSRRGAKIGFGRRCCSRGCGCRAGRRAGR